jgi:hypothetical protein
MNHYYTIPDFMMEDIKFYVEKYQYMDCIISKEEYDLLKTLDINKIHTNENNVIDKFVAIFQNAYKYLEQSQYDEVDELGEEIPDVRIMKHLVDALNNRKKAIQDITNDVLKKREDCCCNY